MHDFFQQLVFDNLVKDLFISLGIIVFVLLLNRILSKYFAGLIFALVRRIWKNVDRKSFLDRLIHPLGIFFIVFFSLIALHRLHFPGLWDIEVYRYSLRDVFSSIGTCVFIISFIWLLLRMIDFIATLLERRADLTSDMTDNQLIVFFRDFFKVLLGIIGLLLILHFAFNLAVGNLLTGLSIVGAAIALSLRESLENLIASFVIFFDKPFSTGDTVKVQGITGSVEKIGLRSTRIRTDQKTYVTMPNKQMVDSILDNLSLRTQHKGELRLELDLRTTSGEIAELIAAIRKLLTTDDIRNFTVLMNGITANAFLVNGDYFTRHITDGEFNSIKERVNFGVLQLLEEMHIEMAGANREIRIVPGDRKS